MVPIDTLSNASASAELDKPKIKTTDSKIQISFLVFIICSFHMFVCKILLTIICDIQTGVFMFCHCIDPMLRLQGGQVGNDEKSAQTDLASGSCAFICSLLTAFRKERRCPAQAAHDRSYAIQKLPSFPHTFPFVFYLYCRICGIKCQCKSLGIYILSTFL